MFQVTHFNLHGEQGTVNLRIVPKYFNKVAVVSETIFGYKNFAEIFFR